MKLNITEQDLETLSSLNWDATTEGGDLLLLSVPKRVGEWVLHDTTIELFREIVKELEDQKLYQEMEAQTIRGQLNISLGAFFNAQ